ncbi:unnamed protein product [Tuber melanosporum]|uniref:(Perigord truffle) hypothetical protein n=1 Tax=Tuber melanosporum (strain Mel28) TaxID=656061 RepID=D5G5Z7_TUBMM|nr:uncharacterized protein GSTUM_00001697001 [Tuber melanosporum]CAZ79940.1 unnamed protein product [Tuber melanosporum]
MLLLPTKRAIRSISLGLEPEKCRPTAGHAGPLCFHPDRKLGTHDMVLYECNAVPRDMGYARVLVQYSTRRKNEVHFPHNYHIRALPPAVNSWYFLSVSQPDGSRVADGMWSTPPQECDCRA